MAKEEFKGSLADGLRKVGFFKAETETNNVSKPVSPQPTNKIPDPSSITDTGATNQKILDMLLKKIADNNIPGMDYFEFAQAISGMKEMNVDEKTKYQMVFNSLKVAGLTKEIILSSIEKYKSLVKAEESVFQKDLDLRNKTNVADKKSSIQKAQERVDAINKELQSLTTFISEETAKVQVEESKLQQAITDFKNSLNYVITILDADKEKVNQFLN